MFADDDKKVDGQTKTPKIEEKDGSVIVGGQKIPGWLAQKKEDLSGLSPGLLKEIQLITMGVAANQGGRERDFLQGRFNDVLQKTSDDKYSMEESSVVLERLNARLQTIDETADKDLGQNKNNDTFLSLQNKLSDIGTLELLADYVANPASLAPGRARVLEEKRGVIDDWNATRNRRNAILEEMEKGGYINLRQIRQSILDSLPQLDWDHVYRDLLERGVTLEAQVRGMAGYKKEWTGAVQTIFELTALEVSTKGKLRKVDELQRGHVDATVTNAWLRNHGATQNKELDELRQDRLRCRFLYVLDFRNDQIEELVGNAIQVEQPPVQPGPPVQPAPREVITQEVVLPGWLKGAVFDTSEYLRGAYDAQGNEVVPILDVREANDREEWVRLNLGRFMDGTVDNPESNWHAVLMALREDMRNSISRLGVQEKSRYKNLPNGERINAERTVDREIRTLRTEADETVKKLNAMMAVAASSVAMEKSAGAGSKYVGFIAPGGEHGPDLDKADDWKEELLHGNHKAYRKAIEDPLVEHYYQKLLIEAGVSINISTRDSNGRVVREVCEPGWKTEEAETVLASDFSVDIAQIDPELIAFLKNGGEGFDGWVQKKIDDENTQNDVFSQTYSDAERESGAQLAWKAFVVDKWTRWSTDVSNYSAEQARIHRNNDLRVRLQPTKTWGGDPLASILEPSFLPRRIKGMYPEDPTVLDLMDRAFRPTDIFAGREHSLVPVSMVGGLKAYARLSDANWLFIGGSQAQEIPVLGKSLMENMPKIAELLDQVYGKTSIDASETERKLAKDTASAMYFRLIQCKVVAALQQRKSDLVGRMNLWADSGDPRAHPYGQELVWLAGPDKDMRSGHIMEMASGRLHFPVRTNRFGTDDVVSNILDMLKTADLKKRGKGLLKASKVFEGASSILGSIPGLGGKKR